MLSIILLSYYSKERIGISYGKVSHLMEENGIPFEFIVIDDGSEDESYNMALELEKMHDNVKAYKLSRNFGSNYAVFAGLSVCRGDCAMESLSTQKNQETEGREESQQAQQRRFRIVKLEERIATTASAPRSYWCTVTCRPCFAYTAHKCFR